MRRLGIVALAIAVLAFAVLRWRGHEPAPAARPAGGGDTLTQGFRTARLWFASADGDSLVSEPRDLAETSDLHARVAALVDELDRGPHTAGAVTSLPAGTTVLHVYLDDRGLMTLDLSQSFRRDFHGGSTAELMTVASVVRTLATNVPDVKRVLLVCGGLPIASLGGHIPLDRPLDVSDWP